MNKREWTQINPDGDDWATFRLKVPGGWLYAVSYGQDPERFPMCFVPEPDKKAEVSE